MTIYGLLTFCAVYAVAVAVPGPGVAAVIARGLAHGLKGTPAFIAGFMVGDLALVRHRRHGPRRPGEDRRHGVRRDQVDRRRLSTVSRLEAVERACANA